MNLTAVSHGYLRLPPQMVRHRIDVSDRFYLNIWIPRAVPGVQSGAVSASLHPPKGETGPSLRNGETGISSGDE